MRQQLRLRVLLPLAVLGLLGAGFGAYAFGQAPEPASEALPPTTTAAAAKPKAVGAVGRKEWAAQVNALCTEAASELEGMALPPHPTPTELENVMSAAVKASATFDKAFVRVGWPRGEKAAVVALRAASVRETALGRSALRAFRAHEVDRFVRLLDRISAGDRWKAQMRRLGAGKCAKEIELVEAARGAEKAKKKGSEAKMPPAVALEWALYFKRAVVVLFYTPTSGLDGTTVLETRSAALDTGAAFLPVNVKVNGQVSTLAERYDVLEAPAILVLVRGPKLSARFDRFVDRQTIAQAVENALR
jgi:hypothetical protein